MTDGPATAPTETTGTTGPATTGPATTGPATTRDEPAEAGPPDAGEAKPAPAPLTTVILVRHGVTEETGPLLSGRRPGIALSETGRAQAARAAELIAGLPVAAVYASPLERCSQTADVIAARLGQKVRHHPGLLEADYGEWSGRRIDELAKTDLWRKVQTAPSTARFPGGESIREMQARIVSALEALTEEHPGAIVVAVSHADPIKAAVAHFAGSHLDSFQRLFVSPASTTVLRLGGPIPMLVKLNDLGGLDDLRPAEGDGVAGAVPSGTGGVVPEASDTGDPRPGSPAAT